MFKSETFWLCLRTWIAHKFCRRITAPKRKNCFLSCFNVRFSRFLFSLAEITLLAFPFLRLAAKRWQQAHFRAAEKNKLPEITNLNFLIALFKFAQLCREFLKPTSRLFVSSIWRIRWPNFVENRNANFIKKQRFNFSAAPTGFYFFQTLRWSNSGDSILCVKTVRKLWT